ncbi:hypothetical protein ACNKHS_24780 [Shigella flexneri]
MWKTRPAQVAIGYIVEALRLRREKGLKAFTVMSCDNVRENGHVAKVAGTGAGSRRATGWRRHLLRERHLPVHHG